MLRQPGCILVLALLLACAGAAANPSRDDTAVLQNGSELHYHSVVAYPPPEAKKERQAWDANLNNSIEAEEAAAYEANAAATRLGNQTSNLRWDGAPTYWTGVSATTQGFATTNSLNGAFTLILDGKVNLTSVEGLNHSLTITNLSAYANYSFSLSVPANWSIVSTAGVAVSSQSLTTVSGFVDPAGLAVIQVTESPPPPPPPPPINDTTPPVVNAGSDRTITAGVLSAFNGSAADLNDTAFPAGASFWWTFTYNGTPMNFSGQNFSYTFWTLGLYTLTFSAIDRSGNRAEAFLHVAVESPDQTPPTVSAGPDASTAAGEPVILHGSASDNDPLFDATGLFWWSFTYNGTPVNLSSTNLTFTFWALGTLALTFSAIDPWGNRASDEMLLEVVSPDLIAPTVSAGPDRTVSAGSLASFSGTATDNDPAFSDGATIWWSFSHNGTAYNLSGLDASFTFWSPGTYTIVLTAVDPWGNRNQGTFSLTVESPDKVPPVVDAGPDDNVTAGAYVALNGSATDDDPAFMSNAVYWWTFNYSGFEANLSGRDNGFRFEVPGTYNVTLWALDGWGNIGRDLRTVVVNPPLPPPNTDGSGGKPSLAAGPGLDLFVSASLVGVGLAALAGIAAYRRRSASATRAAQAPPPPPPTGASARSGPAYVVEGLLVLYNDGRLIHHQAAGTESMFESPEVIGAMFTAVTEFIRDSFREEGALSRLTYGQNTILLERSAHLFGAAIVFGEPDAGLREQLKETLRRIESAYAGVIERWNGDRDSFHGIEGFIAPLAALTAGITRAQVHAATRDQTVKLVSGTEHYKGYLRLRVALVNQTDSKITDATITAVFNQNVLRLARVEPAGVPHEGFTVRLGEVAPGERVGAIYYLDPQTCSQTNIEGITTYRDASGESREVKMKPRMAEIVCPLFFTPHHANPATMRRLVETSLAARDSKLYRVLAVSPAAGYPEIFEVARDAVSRHHVLLVRNLATKAPFDGKAWFYGQTKNTKSPVIIRATVSEERRAIEFFVAVDSPATLTGLLAEFHRSFTEMMRDRLPAVRVEPVLDDALKGLMAAEEFDPRAGDE